MAKTFHLKIVTPDGATFDGDVSSVVLPAWEGQLGVLPGHEPLVAAMKPGALHIEKEGKDEWIAVSGGFAKIGPQEVVILAETAELAEAIDTARVKSKIGEKQDLMKAQAFDDDKIAAMQVSLMKELVRMKVAEKVRKS